MRVTQLRIFRGPDSDNALDSTGDSQTVTAPAGALLPLLADAVNSNRTWLTDFEDDEITISADLYEVLMAYQHFRRPVA